MAYASGPAAMYVPGDAGSASADASQLGGSSDGTVVRLRIGSFNAGVEQSMMTGSNSNYLTAWDFDADTTQLGVREAVPNETYRLSSDICEPELVVHHFEHGAGIHIMYGNLHIRIPHKATVTMAVRKRMAREALEKLEKVAPTIVGAAQPVVYVLVGDCNLSRDLAEEAIQPLQPQNPDREPG